MPMKTLTSAILANLAATPLFEGLNSQDIEQILQHASRTTVPADSYFFHQGDQARRIYILLEGQIKVIQLTPEGQQVVMRMVNPPEIFGCVAALTGGEYPASSQATKLCEAFCLHQDDVHRLMQVYPRMAVNAFQIMVKRTHELQDRYRELATETVERRLAHALLRLMEQSGVRKGEQILLDMPLSRQDLAEMIGSTLYTVSRVLSSWESRGLVAAGREKISLVQPDTLSLIAEARAFSADIKQAPL
ncbi:MAG: Crp/Fnr family transcriptional regulator [Candidatus Melainabacteria bacterium HGW-Melainabacteria-1]|nr:MAG: Crp/Fnr family transcriptional regulator [Candidatus Melainabacteria bacterium HGW-Melainabacteria-1]